MPRQDPVCSLCRMPIHGDVGESFCRGCGAHVCFACDKSTPKEIPHEPSEHREPPKGEEDEPWEPDVVDRDDGIDWDFVLE